MRRKRGSSTRASSASRADDRTRDQRALARAESLAPAVTQTRMVTLPPRCSGGRTTRCLELTVGARSRLSVSRALTLGTRIAKWVTARRRPGGLAPRGAGSVTPRRLSVRGVHAVCWAPARLPGASPSRLRKTSWRVRAAKHARASSRRGFSGRLRRATRHGPVSASPRSLDSPLRGSLEMTAWAGRCAARSR